MKKTIFALFLLLTCLATENINAQFTGGGLLTIRLYGSTLYMELPSNCSGNGCPFQLNAPGNVPLYYTFSQQVTTNPGCVATNLLNGVPWIIRYNPNRRIVDADANTTFLDGCKVQCWDDLTLLNCAQANQL